MSKLWSRAYNNRVYAEYIRCGPEFGTHAFGIFDLDCFKPSMCHLFSWSMAGGMGSGQSDGSKNVPDVHVFYHDSDNRIDHMTAMIHVSLSPESPTGRHDERISREQQAAIAIELPR